MFRDMKYASAMLALAAIAILPIGTLPAPAAVGEWAESQNARVRLIAAGIDAEGRLEAGIEIELDPGWKTYWRSPGDSGIAPTIDFSQSRNLGAVDIAYPVPHRLEEDYGATNIYKERVILPVTAAVADPGAPVDLAVKLDIGVCAEVCVPDHFEAELRLTAGESDPEARQLLAAARSSLPGAAEPGVFEVDKAVRAGGDDKRPVFEITALVPDKESATVFVEGPPDWYPDVPSLVSEAEGRSVYRVTFDRLTAKTPIEGSKLRVTIASGGRAVEETLALD